MTPEFIGFKQKNKKGIELFSLSRTLRQVLNRAVPMCFFSEGDMFWYVVSHRQVSSNVTLHPQVRAKWRINDWILKILYKYWGPLHFSRLRWGAIVPLSAAGLKPSTLLTKRRYKQRYTSKQWQWKWASAVIRKHWSCVSSRTHSSFNAFHGFFYGWSYCYHALSLGLLIWSVSLKMPSEI